MDRPKKPFQTAALEVHSDDPGGTPLNFPQGNYPIQPGSARDNSSFPIIRPHSFVRKQRIGGPVRKNEKGVVVVVDRDKVNEEDGSYGTGTGGDVQVYDSDGTILQD